MEEQAILEEVKELDTPFWVFTTNCLKPFKGYFATHEQALAKVFSIIKTSKPWYKKQLIKEAHHEAINNAVNINNPAHKQTFRAQRRNAEWHDYSEPDLVSSVKIIDLSSVNKETREKIFLERVK